MSTNKKEKMISFWSDRAKQYESDPRANTNDIWLREIEIAYVDQIIKERGLRRILDVGCANGYSTNRLAKANPEASFTGIDINPDMIAVAQKYSAQDPEPNLEFRRVDVLEDTLPGDWDFVFTIRVFQNMESAAKQRQVFDRLSGLLKPGGLLLTIESYADGYTRLNEDRVKLGLPPLPIHEHLTLLASEFDTYAGTRMTLLRRHSLSSSYYLTTRLLYSYIAKANNEAIDYNHPIHQVAAMIPQVGDYGPQNALLWEKPPSATTPKP